MSLYYKSFRILQGFKCPRVTREVFCFPTRWSSSLVHGPLMSSGLRTFCHLCWHCTSVRFWLIQRAETCFVISFVWKSFLNNNKNFAKKQQCLVFHMKTVHVSVWPPVRLLTLNRLAMSFQSSDPWSSTSFFNFSSWKKKKKAFVFVKALTSNPGIDCGDEQLKLVLKRFAFTKRFVYLFPCPAGFAKVALSCLGHRPIIVVIIHICLLVIFLAAVNTASTERESTKM